MKPSVHVLVDSSDGRPQSTSLEAMALGQALACSLKGPVQAILLGEEVETAARQLSGYDLDSILTVKDTKLAQYDPDIHCEALSQLTGQERPTLVLMAHSYENIDLAPKLAARLGCALVTDCIGFRQEREQLIFVRQMFRNKLNADVAVRSDPPWIVTVQSGAAAAEDLTPGSAPTRECSVDLSAVESRREVLERVAAGKDHVDLSQAEIIVGVGRGIRKPENLKLIEELAQALGAEIGASRPVVDSKWLGRDRQIGSSGQTVAPKLYVACGISGAIQHLVGMKKSSCIVAINIDPNAPIFSVATYGVVGDLLEIVPALTRQLKALGQG